MYRYFALIWDIGNPQASAHAAHLSRRLREVSPDWVPVVDEPGLSAFHAGAGGTTATSRQQVTSSDTRVFPGGAGVVFGRVFRTGHEFESCASGQFFPEGEANSVCATAGVHFIENYWGRYVAFIRDASRRSVAVLRDPTGGLPCFATEQGGVRAVFSDIESCLSLGGFKFSINWKYIAAVVPYSALQISDTGLNEVWEIQPGERVVFQGADVKRTLLWQPSQIASRNRIEEPVVATAAVRETVKQCVHAWASLHRSLVHNLSGGLDSSIVLGCLKSAPNRPSITCLHFYVPNSYEDEREYARLTAHHLDADLVECPIDPSAVPLERMQGIRPSPKPWFYIYDLVHSPLEARAMDDHGATGVFSGAGGDGLFVQARAELAVADYFRHHGMRPGALRVALDAARINRGSVWPILYQGLLRHLKRPPRNALSEFADVRALIPHDVFEAARNNDNLFHPWIREASGLTPGLLWQILSLSVPSPYYESFGGHTELERTPVLMSQPLMELCLRIPTYIWISGGRDRSIARRAFSDVLPEAVMRRTQKGHLDRYNRKVLDENAAFIRDMLLDGLLVRAGLLDRNVLEAYINADVSSASFEYNEVLRQHLCTEIWLRRWAALTTSCER